MNSVISLGRFRAETESYKHFLLTYENPLVPISFSIIFDHIAVSLSASPYIAFKNDNTKLCLSHIETIKKNGCSKKEKCYILICNDHSASNVPVSTRFSLRCY